MFTTQSPIERWYNRFNSNRVNQWLIIDRTCRQVSSRIQKEWPSSPWVNKSKLIFLSFYCYYYILERCLCLLVIKMSMEVDMITRTTFSSSYFEVFEGQDTWKLYKFHNIQRRAFSFFVVSLQLEDVVNSLPRSSMFYHFKKEDAKMGSCLKINFVFKCVKSTPFWYIKQ